jgi:hypothetical protein
VSLRPEYTVREPASLSEPQAERNTAVIKNARIPQNRIPFRVLVPI